MLGKADAVGADGRSPCGGGDGAAGGAATGSLKPGGRIDSGVSWPSAGMPIATKPSASAPAPTLFLERRKRDNLFNTRQRLFAIQTGKHRSPAQQGDKQHGNDDQRATHDENLISERGRQKGQPVVVTTRLLPERHARCIAPAIMLQNHSHPSVWQGQPIVLVGLMGVGKSTVGRRLAARLALPFVDADSEIEAAAGMTIADIFERFGEEYFRDGERRVIARLIDGQAKVIATGGGAFINPETRALILDQAVAVWLDANPRILAERVKRRDTRPLLRGRDPATVLTALAEARNPIYALAPIHVSSQQAPHETTVAAIIKALGLMPPGDPKSAESD